LIPWLTLNHIVNLENHMFGHIFQPCGFRGQPHGSRSTMGSTQSLPLCVYEQPEFISPSGVPVFFMKIEPLWSDSVPCPAAIGKDFYEAKGRLK